MNQNSQKSKPFNPDDYLEILRYRNIPQPIGYKAGDHFYVMKINGDSLRDEGILIGHWITYKVASEANAGQLCLIKTPEGETVRFYHPQANGRITLTAANDDYPPQTWLPHEVELRGIVTMSGRDWL